MQRRATAQEQEAAETAVSVAASDEQRSAEKIGLVPSAGMAAAAKRGLKLHEDGRSGDGLKPETAARAKRIAAREELTPDHVREMRAWFRRHKVDKRPGWNKAGEETPGYTAWMLWGGDPAWRWSEAKVAQMERSAEDRDVGEEGVEDEYEGVLSERELATAEAYESIAEEYGPWSQKESHYIAESPFGAINCKNCVFFEGEGRCYIVAGDIAPEAVCKLWVIPEGKMSEESVKEEPAKAEDQPQQVQERDETANAIAKAAALKAILLTTQLHAASSAS